MFHAKALRRKVLFTDVICSKKMAEELIFYLHIEVFIYLLLETKQKTLI